MALASESRGEGGREGGLFTIEIAEEDVFDAAAHTNLYLAAGRTVSRISKEY